jgi:hypothetical protein
VKFTNPFRRKPKQAVVPTAKVVDNDPLDESYYPDKLELTGIAKSLQRTISDFEVVSSNPMAAMDAAVIARVGDSMDKSMTVGMGSMSAALAEWYNSQGFIGHQQCAILAQHWLVAKACTMSVEDSVRNGWDVDFKGVDDKAHVEELTNKVKELDKKFKTDDVFTEAGKFTNIFGIRVLIPIIESSDPDYYQKQFNPDGITAGSFRGWSQVDPMWIFPLLDTVGASDATSPHFYDPAFWITGGKQYHRSHLVILRGDEPADILKPSYMFGGIPLTQRIAERVYAAERTANEAPLLAMSKRTTALKVDMAKAGLKRNALIKKLTDWITYRDNFGIKLLGKDEELQQTDTSLADLDVVIMTQYQIVAAIAKTPSTKLLGTSPKGFNPTGEGEADSYHEFLESIQTGWGNPFLERHYLLMSLSYFDGVQIEHTWQPVDSVKAEALANMQKVKAETGGVLIDKGVISPDEERQRLRLDKDSGYTLTDEEAPGVPEPTPPEGGGGFGDEAENEDINIPVVEDEAEGEADVTQAIAAAVAVAALIAQQQDEPAGPGITSLIRKLATALAPTAVGEDNGDALIGVKPSVDGLDQTAKPTVISGVPVPEKIRKPTDPTAE